jgi:hypothetical protein
MWPNLHEIPQNMQSMPNLDPKISKVVPGKNLAHYITKYILLQIANQGERSYEKLQNRL